MTNRSTRTQNDKALNAFISAKAEIDTMLERLLVPPLKWSCVPKVASPSGCRSRFGQAGPKSTTILT